MTKNFCSEVKFRDFAGHFGRDMSKSLLKDTFFEKNEKQLSWLEKGEIVREAISCQNP